MKKIGITWAKMFFWAAVWTAIWASEGDFSSCVQSGSSSNVRFCRLLNAQGTLADYQRADSLGARFANKVFKANVRPFWAEDESFFWYENRLSNDEKREFVFIDVEKGERSAAFDHVQLANELEQLTGLSIDPQRLPIRILRFEDVMSENTQIENDQTKNIQTENILKEKIEKNTEENIESDKSGNSPVQTGKKLIFRLTMSSEDFRQNAEEMKTPVDSRTLFLWDGKKGILSVLDDKLQNRNEDGNIGLTSRPDFGFPAGKQTEIIFENQLNGSIRIFWMKEGAPEVPYAAIEPGKKYAQHTFAGHVWRIADSENRTLGFFVGSDGKNEVCIDTPFEKLSEETQKILSGRERGNRRSSERPARFTGQNRSGNISPDRQFEVFVQNNNVFLRVLSQNNKDADAKENNETRNNNKNNNNIENNESNPKTATDLEPENREFELDFPENVLKALSSHKANEKNPNRGVRWSAFYWSPDSKKLVGIRTEDADEHLVYMVESSPKDQLQPKLISHQYLKPGDQVEVSKPVLFDIESRKAIVVQDTLFANPWSTGYFSWKDDSSGFRFFFNERGHQNARYLEIDAKTGNVRALINEETKSFFCYSGKMFFDIRSETEEAVWMSERSGWNHLYLYDLKTGTVKNPITQGNWVVRSVERIDWEKRQIWLKVSGLVPGEDPYYLHFVRVNFDGSGFVRLTNGCGTHSIEYSPSGKYLIDSWSQVDVPPETALRRTEDGSLVCLLEKSDMSELLAAGWIAPERFCTKGRDGTTDIFGVIVRPTNFDSSKKYPVIEYIYAGPQDSFVPKGFSPYQHQLMRMAELGFILVQIDGMGTSNRSKAFHDVCWKNLADAGFPDRILWIKEAAKKYPQMNLEQGVGIFGGSAGGQNSTGALLLHGDFYTVAVSDCGCHDNRMDKIWWNEQWMGFPIGKHYEEQSNTTLAKNLKGHLMLFVGEIDSNVDPASTMQVANALIKADKDFDLIVMPGSNHGSAECPYGVRRRSDFFVRHLLGVEPRR